MKKLFAIILCVISGFALVSCNDIKETINELKKIAISETVNVLTDELGIDDFYIPECETLNLGKMGGLLGSAPVMPVHGQSSEAFIARGGRIPAPLQSLKN